MKFPYALEIIDQRIFPPTLRCPTLRCPTLRSPSPTESTSRMGQCHNIPDSSVRVTTVAQTPPPSPSSSRSSSSFRLTKEQLAIMSSEKDDDDRASFNAMSMFCGDQAASKYSNSTAVLRRESSSETLTSCSDSDVGSMCSIESLCIEQSNVETHVLVIERSRTRASVKSFATSQPILKNDVLASLLWRGPADPSRLLL